ncbi:hypothetical protein A2W70_00645 [Candidatus Curtissbacteria bacterium RIFCSPLOWO2_02_41_11]|uniref:Gram-positive cocci surface proteins LPxTG domain-containing protein n=2 Tax=Candidatus Curtissiibacteriota TaxID=1752717 RepID=A0A1F5HSJ9_9BACT|nr:MAG: hypothetical protein UU56_C0027G0004 [Candidatus Curtissbacteria bacterium GW2011_GWA2_41_24]OGE07063.1 MAG: hypothetical protein A2W70_00645 [Candidatus Curtissbacteria bacterium RIFCSPLOWO2_02_41_11]
MKRKYFGILFVLVGLIVMSFITASALATQTIIQQNQGVVKNIVGTQCNTGSNQVSGGNVGSSSIDTGDCSAGADVSNQVNTNVVQVGCPTCPTPTPTPGASPAPSASPTTPPSGGGGGVTEGGGGGAAGPSEQGQAAPQVLAAAGVAQDTLLFLTGFGLLIFGLWQAQKVLKRQTV